MLYAKGALQLTRCKGVTTLLHIASGLQIELDPLEADHAVDVLGNMNRIGSSAQAMFNYQSNLYRRPGTPHVRVFTSQVQQAA